MRPSVPWSSLTILCAVAGTAASARAVTPRPAAVDAAPSDANTRAVTSSRMESVSASVARTRAGGGQGELAVGFDAKGVLRTAVCSAPQCSVEAGLELPVPASAATQRTLAQLIVVPIGEERSAIVIRVPTSSPNQAWQAVVVAVPGQKKARVLFEGLTGYVSGEPGLRQGRQVQITEATDDVKARRIVVGDLHEDLTLCHREALLSPQLLDPRSLELKPAKVQRLSAQERDKAQPIVAELVKDESAMGAGAASGTGAPATMGKDARLLRAVGASSAVGWPSALTDGDPETTWAENRGGAGRGEFIVMRALSDVPINAFDLVVRPAHRSVPNAVGAETLWLATTHDVYKVRFAEDPWKVPGAHWRIALGHPIVTDCVALVTDTAYGESPKSEVTFAELNVRTEFESANIDNLLGALAGGGPRAEAAGSVLSGFGDAAVNAVDAKFESLDEGGRRVALDVVDHASCAGAAPVYVKALQGAYDAQKKHALDRLRRCGEGAKPTLIAAAAKANGKSLLAIIEALCEVAPDAAMTVVMTRLDTATSLRKPLREVLERAAKSEHSDATIREYLARQDLTLDARIDLLQALEQRVTEFAPASVALMMQTAQAGIDWRHRYRLIGTAQNLAASNPTVRDWLARVIMSDQSPFVRMQAAGSVKLPGLFRAELLKALQDSEVRVREAAVQALSSRAADFARAALVERMHNDEWPIVRSAAADALAAQPPDGEADTQLAKTLSDSSPLVRSHAIDALGHRQAYGQASKILDHFQKRDEHLSVRMSAARALGWLCNANSISALSEQARTLTDPMLDAEQRALAGVSLAALSRIHPSNLRDLLAPLLADKGVAPSVKRIAQTALDSKEHCAQLH
jgi:HEAT repeat protein